MTEQTPEEALAKISADADQHIALVKEVIVGQINVMFNGLIEGGLERNEALHLTSMFLEKQLDTINSQGAISAMMEAIAKAQGDDAE